MDNHTPPPSDDTPPNGVPSEGTPSEGMPSDNPAFDSSSGSPPSEPSETTYSPSFEASQVNGPENGFATDRATEIAARGGFRLGAPGGAVSRSAMGSTFSAEENAIADDYAASLQPTVQTLARDEAFEEPALADALDSPNDFYGAQAPEPELAAVAAVDNRDKELDLIEHLRELRSRILFCFGAVFVAMCVTWYFGTTIQKWLVKPIESTLAAKGLQKGGFGGTLTVLDPIDGFSIYFQVTFAAALLVCAPILIWQLWAFVEPALTKNERRYISILVPFSTILFVVGAALGYLMSPVFFQFFLAFQPPGSIALWSYMSSITLLAKMMLVFGVCFQTPVVTIFLMKTGIVGRNVLLEYWRHAVVVIFVIVAIITPTWDPVTLIACATPPCILYGLSLWMVKWL